MQTITPGPKPLLELAQEKLGDALFLDVMREEAEDPGDPELRRYLCHDLNGVLSDCHTGETVLPNQMDNPRLFQVQLRGYLETPARVLVAEHLEYLKAWLADEPPEGHENREMWAAQGRHLLNRAR